MKSVVSQTNGIISTISQNLNNINTLSSQVKESINATSNYTVRTYEVKPVTSNLNNINLDLDGGSF